MRSNAKRNQKGLFIRHNVDFTPKGPLTHLRVQNEMMLMAVRAQHIQHIRLQNAKVTDIQLPLAIHDRIANIHLDFNGIHALISSSGGENYYLNMKTVQLKPLKKLKGLTVTAVGWNLEYSKDSETGFIVLGTNKGQIMEANISSNGNISYMKTLSNDLSEDKGFAVTDLQLHQNSDDVNDKWTLFVCTPCRLYILSGIANITATTPQPTQQMVGTGWGIVMSEQSANAVLQPLFNFKTPPKYHSLKDEKASLPSGLAIFPTTSSEQPKHYAWLSVEGISMGTVDLSTAGEPYDIVTEEAQLKHKRVEGRFDFPLDMALTEYHLVLLHNDRFIAISRINQKTAFEDNFSAENLQVIGMTRDASSQFIWVFTDSSIFKYRPFDETRHIWRMYLERKEYAKARIVTSQMQDPAPYQMVIKKEAEKFLAEENYEAAAELLSQSTDPFDI
jgi:hypothetical protein